MVNSLILNMQDIAIFPDRISDICTGKISSSTGKEMEICKKVSSWDPTLIGY